MTVQPTTSTQPSLTYAERWHANYNAVREFIAEHNRLPRPHVSDAAEKKLGLWCHANRQRYAGTSERTPLPVERVALLEALPHWRWVGQRSRDSWRERYARLLAFVQVNGRLPYAAAEDEAERELGIWRNMNKNYRRDVAKQHLLSPERIALLEAVPGWDWGAAYRGWDAWYADYAQFVASEGRLPQTQVAASAERDLAFWGVRQLDKRDGRSDSSPHTPEQIALLEVLPGWRWRSTKAERWTDKLQPVLDLLAANPGATVHALPSQVADWLREQEGDWAQLTTEQQEQLRSLPIWPPNKRINASWLRNYREMLLLCRTEELMPDMLTKSAQDWLTHQERRFSELGVEQQELLGQLKCYPLSEFSAAKFRSAQQQFI